MLSRPLHTHCSIPLTPLLYHLGHQRELPGENPQSRLAGAQQPDMPGLVMGRRPRGDPPL